jgi:hypothetical protein
LKCDGTCAETRFRLSAKRTSPFKSAGASVQSTTGSRGVHITGSRLRLKCDGTRAETRFRLSAKRTSPFKSAGASVQSTTGSRGVRISGSNAGYTEFRSNVKGFGYLLLSPVSPSLPLATSPCAITFQLDSTLSNFCCNDSLNRQQRIMEDAWMNCVKPSTFLSNGKGVEAVEMRTY